MELPITLHSFHVGQWWAVPLLAAEEKDDLKHYKIVGVLHIFENSNIRGMLICEERKPILEGGHRVPFIVRWPSKIQVAGKSNQLVELTDLLATVADITGAKLPEGAGPDSVSFLPELLRHASRKSGREYSVPPFDGGSFCDSTRAMEACCEPSRLGWI